MPARMPRPVPAALHLPGDDYVTHSTTPTDAHSWILGQNGRILHAVAGWSGRVVSPPWVMAACSTQIAGRTPSAADATRVPRCKRCCNRMGVPAGRGVPANENPASPPPSPPGSAGVSHGG